MRQYDQIAAALSKAQAAIAPASRDKKNPFHGSTYAGLDSIAAVIRQPLADNGLCYTQTFDHRLEGLVIRTTLLHVSGQYITSTLRMNPVKSDPQGIGSAITYGRRYALAALLGVVSDDDDDGHAATHPDKKPDKKTTENNFSTKKFDPLPIDPKPGQAPAPGPDTWHPSPSDLQKLFATMRRHKWDEAAARQMLADHYGYTSSRQIASPEIYAQILQVLADSGTHATYHANQDVKS